MNEPSGASEWAGLPHNLRRALEGFLRADDAAAARAVVEQHQELLGDAVQQALIDAAERSRRQGEPNAADAVRALADLLVRCRDEGIDAVYGPIIEHDAFPVRFRALLETVRQEDAGWERNHDPAALRRAARAWQDISAILPLDAPDPAGADSEAARRMLRCYASTGDLADLEAGRTLISRAVARTGIGSPERAQRLVNLGDAWRRTYERTGDPADLERALDAGEEALAGTPSAAGHRPAALANLAVALRERYRLHGDPADLDRAVALNEEALRYLPADGRDRDAGLNGLANALSMRYDRRRDPRDLERLVAAREEAVALGHHGTVEHARLLHNLGNAYSDRADVTGDRNDFDRAITLIEQALSATPPESPGYASACVDLGRSYFQRYARSGSLSDLDRSIDINNDALARCAPEDPRWPSVANDVAVTIRERFTRLGAFDDLERVVAILTEVTNRTPPSSPEAFARFGNLGNALRARYLRAHRDEDLGRAIAAYERALALQPADRAADPRLFTNIGTAIQDRYERSGDEADLDRAERHYSEAFRHSVPGSSDQVNARNNLARILMARARTSGSPELLREAESAFRKLVDLTPARAPSRLMQEMNLASARMELHRATADEEAGTAASAGFRAIVGAGRTVLPDLGLAAARAWGRWASDRGEWEEAAEAYQAGMACLDLLYRRQGRRDQKETWLGDAAGIASGAAYALARTGDVGTAVVAAETGRAVIMTETLLRTTTELESLARFGHADLAEQFRLAVDALAAAENTGQPGIESPTDGFAERPAAADLRAALDKVITRIQALPGFDDFRRPPTIAAVTATAGTTPLVYLVPASAGGVALVVRGRRCEATWLPELTTETLSARVASYLDAYANRQRDPARWPAALLDLTGWLWPAVLAPVVEALSGQDEVVLVPMGVLGMLPLHAAWRPDPIAPTGRRYALDDLIISYAPNARSLALARLVPAVSDVDGILAIADPRPVSAEPLRYADSEAAAALDRFPRGLRLAGPQATRAAVLTEMVRWPVLHFACHGYADVDQPINSAVLLANDERVRLGDLFGSDAFHPGLVILSACESAVIGGKALDEVVSLPSGFLQSGARGVVGSFWSVYDASTALLMHRYYKVWRGAGQPTPAAALRTAQQWLRDTPPEAVRKELDTRSLLRDAGLEGQIDNKVLAWEHPVHWAAFAYFGA